MYWVVQATTVNLLHSRYSSYFAGTTLQGRVMHFLADDLAAHNTRLDTSMEKNVDDIRESASQDCCGRLARTEPYREPGRWASVQAGRTCSTCDLSLIQLGGDETRQMGWLSTLSPLAYSFEHLDDNTPIDAWEADHWSIFQDATSAPAEDPAANQEGSNRWRT